MPATSHDHRDSLFIRACRREVVSRTPVWMMRQAGRYLPQYRAVRAKSTFLEVVKTPELACEVTLQPIDEFGFDAAILFCDILVPLEAMGLELAFTPAPKLGNPVANRADVDRLVIPDPTRELGFVMEAVAMISAELRDRVPLIGFAGAPFTLATYAIEGAGSKSWPKTKALLYQQTDAAHELLRKLASCQAQYLAAQIAAGACAVQLFDSWAGILSRRDFREFALRYTRQVVDELRATAEWKARSVPIIYFVNGCAPYLDMVTQSDADVIGIDWRIDLDAARAALGPEVAVQGNMDPTCLFLPETQLRERVREVIVQAGDDPGHIFNLGHGILPSMDPERVRCMVEAVATYSARSND